MKTKLFILTLAVSIFIFSCEDEETTQPQVSSSLKELSETKLKLQSIRNLNLNNTFRFGSMTMNVKSNKFLPKAAKDSIYNEWETCAKIKNYTDENGFEVMEMDYGVDGCEEYGELIKGKVTWKWKMDDKGWAYEDIYENYEAWGMKMNGTYKGECKWTGTVNWDDFTDTTYFTNWFSEDYEEICSDEENMVITFDTGEEVTYVSNYKSKFTYNQHVMLEGNFTYNSSAGESYTWQIDEPVVSDFNCKYWIPVSGIESGNDGKDDYIINYGDGSCDNQYSITINGVTEIIEVNDDYFYIEE